MLYLKNSKHVLGIKYNLFGEAFSSHIGFIHTSEYSHIDDQTSLVTKLSLIESSWCSFSDEETEQNSHFGSSLLIEM